MSVVRTQIIPGFPLKVSNLLWQEYGPEPSPVELYNVNVGQIDPSFEYSYTVSGTDTIETLATQIFGCSYEEEGDWEWEWPKVARAEDARVSCHSLLFCAWAPDAVGASRRVVVSGLVLLAEVIVAARRSFESARLMQESAQAASFPTDGTVFGLRTYGARYTEFGPFAVSCADGQLSVALPGFSFDREGDAGRVSLAEDGGLPELQELGIRVNYSGQSLRARSTAAGMVMILDYRGLINRAYGSN
jgi:hypothetical protein